MSLLQGLCKILGTFLKCLELFLFLGLLRAPTRNIPERVWDTIRTLSKNRKLLGLGNPLAYLLSKGLKIPASRCSAPVYWQIVTSIGEALFAEDRATVLKDAIMIGMSEDCRADMLLVRISIVTSKFEVHERLMDLRSCHGQKTAVAKAGLIRDAITRFAGGHAGT